MPLDGPGPESRIELKIGNQIVYRRPFDLPGRVEVYGGRHEWVRLAPGSVQVFVTLLPDLPHVDMVHAIGPSGIWFQRPLL